MGEEVNVKGELEMRDLIENRKKWNGEDDRAGDDE